MSQKISIITGGPGQDANHLSRLLIDKDYKVILTHKYSSTPHETRFSEYISHPNLEFTQCDITDSGRTQELIQQYQPDEVYNLAALSHVGYSFEHPRSVFNVNTFGVLNILEAIRLTSPQTRFYQAGTSEQYGNNKNENGLRDELTPFSSRSPYGTSKIASYEMVNNYREAYNLHASVGILFNHEGEFRGEQFVTRKITKYVAELQQWLKQGGAADTITKAKSSVVWKRPFGGSSCPTFPKLALGNLDARRDWGYAGDYVEGMWRMIQQDYPDNYVLATGETHSIRECLDVAFKEIGIAEWSDFVRIDPQFYRPTEVDVLIGDSTKAKEKLGWQPQVGFEELIRKMVRNDVAKYKWAIYDEKL